MLPPIVILRNLSSLQEKRWQLSKHGERDRRIQREEVEPPGAEGPADPDTPHQQGQQISNGDQSNSDEKSDLAPFPIFKFNAKPTKRLEVKPIKKKKVNAEKGKVASGSSSIKAYFTLLGESADTEPVPIAPATAAAELPPPGQESKHLTTGDEPRMADSASSN